MQPAHKKGQYTAHNISLQSNEESRSTDKSDISSDKECEVSPEGTVSTNVNTKTTKAEMTHEENTSSHDMLRPTWEKTELSRANTNPAVYD